MTSAKQKMLIAFVTTLVLTIVVACYSRKIPIGANPFPYLACAPETDSLNSKGVSYLVVYNDAGATHSGNHMCWIVHEGRFFDRVVRSGYVEFDWEQRRPILKTRVVNGSLQLFFMDDSKTSNGYWKPF